jgi:hypothetical protein
MLFLVNESNNWDWNYSYNWKHLVLNENGIPYNPNVGYVQNNIIEYGKDGSDDYVHIFNDIEDLKKTFVGSQIGPDNTNLDVYGKFFSLFTNKFTLDRLNDILQLFNLYTFMHGYTDDYFEVTILGAKGSLARLMTAYAVQLSQINDNNRNISESTLVENKEGYDLLKAYSSYSLDSSIDLSRENIKILLGLLSKRIKPTLDNIAIFMESITGIDSKYYSIEESDTGAYVIIDVPYPQPNGIFSQIFWLNQLSNFISKLKGMGIIYEFKEVLLIISENASGRYQEITDQVTFT